MKSEQQAKARPEASTSEVPSQKDTRPQCKQDSENHAESKESRIPAHAAQQLPEGNVLAPIGSQDGAKGINMHKLAEADQRQNKVVDADRHIGTADTGHGSTTVDVELKNLTGHGDTEDKSCERELKGHDVESGAKGHNVESSAKGHNVESSAKGHNVESSAKGHNVESSADAIGALLVEGPHSKPEMRDDSQPPGNDKYKDGNDEKYKDASEGEVGLHPDVLGDVDVSLGGGAWTIVLQVSSACMHVSTCTMYMYIYAYTYTYMFGCRSMDDCSAREQCMHACVDM